MKENSFYNKIHRLGRITVVCALISFMAVPFGLAAVNGISMNIPEILKNAIPLLLTFSISGICENLSFMPIIGSGALYMSRRRSTLWKLQDTQPEATAPMSLRSSPLRHPHS